MCASSLLAAEQQAPPLTPDERREILAALIEREGFAAKVKELEGLLSLSDEQLRLAAERLRLERDIRLQEKKLHLAALKTIAEYRIKRRSGFLKALLFIPTLGHYRDKHDKVLEAQIVELEKEIQSWR